MDFCIWCSLSADSTTCRSCNMTVFTEKKSLHKVDPQSLSIFCSRANCISIGAWALRFKNGLSELWLRFHLIEVVLLLSNSHLTLTFLWNYPWAGTVNKSNKGNRSKGSPVTSWQSKVQQFPNLFSFFHLKRGNLKWKITRT